MMVPGYCSLLEHALSLAPLGAVLLRCHSAGPSLVTAFALRNSVLLLGHKPWIVMLMGWLLWALYT